MKPVFRCSSLDRMLGCHASVTLESKVCAVTEDVFGGAETGHAVQWAGSWCHHQAAARLRDEFGAVGTPDPLTIPSHFKPSGFDEWVVDWYVTRVTKIVPSDWAMFIEREAVMEFPRFILTGHIDFSAISTDGLQGVIDDLKRGYEVVDAADSNWQLAGYCALLSLQIPTLEKLLLRIHQPAAPERTTEACVTNIPAVIASLERAINAMLDDPYTTNTGKPCKNCKAPEICPTFRKDIKLMRETLSKEFIDSIPSISSTADLAELAYHCKKLEYPAKRMVESFKSRVEQEGGEVEFGNGQFAKIIEEEGNREITDVQFAHGEVAAKCGAQAAWGTLKLSVGGVEEALAETGMQKSSKKKDVETVKTWVDANLGGVITRKKQKTLTFV